MGLGDDPRLDECTNLHLSWPRSFEAWSEAGLVRHPPYTVSKGVLTRLLNQYERRPRCRVCGKEIMVGDTVTSSKHGNLRHLYHLETSPRRRGRFLLSAEE